MNLLPLAGALVGLIAAGPVFAAGGACPVFEATCGCEPGQPAMVAVRDGLITIEVDTRPQLAAVLKPPALAIGRKSVQEFQTYCHCRPGEPASIVFQEGWSAIVRPPDEEPGLAWTMATIGDACIAPIVIE